MNKRRSIFIYLAALCKEDMEVIGLEGINTNFKMYNLSLNFLYYKKRSETSWQANNSSRWHWTVPMPKQKTKTEKENKSLITFLEECHEKGGQPGDHLT